MTAAPPEQPVTLLLSRRDVARLMRPRDYLEAVEAGFKAAAEGRAAAPAPLSIEGVGGAFHAKGAAMRSDRHYAALKLNGNFPDNKSGLPTVQGAILLCDAENGALLAVMDSIEVTLRRTAAATALAARHLARAQSETLLICGCGAQGLVQLEALADVLPLKRCIAWDRDAGRAERLAALAAGRLGLDARAATDVAQWSETCDVIVTCTTAARPFLHASHVSPGTFVAAVGADSPSKCEIHPELMAKARVVVDSLEQCLDMGDLRHAVAAGAMRMEHVHAALEDLVAGRSAGRTDDAEIFLFDSTGTALQDVAAAAAIYARAAGQAGFRTMAFGAA
jgi:ornithine cyclodeaminase/alanine dehydrogenase-like protein (mu-crystallin family)